MGFADQKSFNAALQANPKLHPASADALLDAYRRYIAQMQPRLPELFGTLPKAKLEVVAMPDYMAPNQPQAFYDQGTPDGHRPGKSMSTPTTSPTARWPMSKPSPTTRVSPATTCKSPSSRR